jgi:hypothetical protein
LWNDLYPYAPVRNGNVDQVALRNLLDSRSGDILVTAMQSRMNEFIEDEIGKGFWPYIYIYISSDKAETSISKLMAFR